MNDIPRLALSVRQPWPWAILHAGKDIENRSWQAVGGGRHAVYGRLNLSSWISERVSKWEMRFV